MGEIDTKPIEPVQNSLSLFGEKGDQKKNRSTGSDDEKERELESVLRDLANYKVQLEAKEVAYMQAILKLEQSQKTVDELSTLVKNSEIERDRHEKEFIGARARIDGLESEMKAMADQLSETENIRRQLSQVVHELNAVQEELLCKENELGAARDSELKSLKEAEMMEVDMNMERLKCEDLMKQVSELNEVILVSKEAADEAQKEKSVILSEKDSEIEVAKKALGETEERIKDMKRSMEMMEELENELLSKSILVDALQLQLKEADEKLCFSEKSAVEAFTNLKLLREELECKDRKCSSQEALIAAFKMEMSELQFELKNVNELASHLMVDVEMLTGDLQKVKSEIDEMRRRETEAEIEMALLKSELHKGRSKIAAAEAAEARAASVKSGLYLAVRELAVEAGSVKKENQRLKEATGEENEVYFSQVDDLNTEAEEKKDDSNGIMNTSLEEIESLIKKAEESNDQISVPMTEDSGQLTASEYKHELENLRMELDAAMAKVAEFRNRAEQATCRAEMAERAKTAIEEQLRKWREERQKKKAAAAAAALKEASTSKELSITPADNKPAVTNYQPLYKVLNMKF